MMKQNEVELAVKKATAVAQTAGRKLKAKEQEAKAAEGKSHQAKLKFKQARKESSWREKPPGTPVRKRTTRRRDSPRRPPLPSKRRRKQRKRQRSSPPARTRRRPVPSSRPATKRLADPRANVRLNESHLLMPSNRFNRREQFRRRPQKFRSRPAVPIREMQASKVDQGTASECRRRLNCNRSATWS